MPGPNPEIEADLRKLIGVWRSAPKEPEKLVAQLMRARSRYDTLYEDTKDRVIPSKMRDDMQMYVEALETAREAWFKLPDIVQSVMHQNMPYTKSSLLSEDILRSLQLGVFTSDKLASIPEWRREELEYHDTWSSDLEMIDLLIAIARKWQELHQPESHSRPRPKIGLTADVATIFRKHNLKISPYDGTRFMGVLKVLLQNKNLDKKLIKLYLEEINETSKRG